MADESPEILARRFSGWRFWWSRDDRGRPVTLNATRQRRLTDTELQKGLAQTLPVGAESDLLKQLEEQERLAGGRT
jgi:hypothetical protein